MQNAGTAILKNLLAVAAGVLEFAAPFNGTIKRIDIFAKAANVAGDTTFDVNIDGVTIFADQTTRPKILQNAVTGSVSGLAVAVVRGQWISIDCDVLAAGGFPGKISLSVTIEDVYVIGAANGVAGLDAGAKVPVAQLPAGIASGIAALDSGAKVPVAQLPAGVASGVASLDSGGKVPIAQLPAIAISDVFTVASQAAMLALTAEIGDVAIRTDTNVAYILAVADPTVLANWKQLPQTLTASPIGAAGGDLNGNYPNPGIAKISGRTIYVPPAASSINDAFTGNYASFWSPTGSVAGNSNRLEITSNATSAIEQYLDSGAADFTGGKSVRATIAQIQTNDNARLMFSIYIDANNYYKWVVNLNGKFGFDTKVAGVASVQVPGNFGSGAAVGVMLRARNTTGNSIAFEWSTNGGTSWSAFDTATFAVGITSVRVRIGMYQTATITGQVVAWDDVVSDLSTVDQVKANYGIVWDGTNNRFTVARAIGVVRTVPAGSPPTTAPADLPAGFTEVVIELTNPVKMWAWNVTTAAWNSQQF